MPYMTDRIWNFAYLGDRIAYALQECGLGPAEIARRVGVRRPAVDQWLSGDTKNLKMDNLFALADVSGFSPRWIARNEGPQKEDKRESALLDLYRHSDERGQQTILRVAEQESHYGDERDATQAGAG